MVIVMGNLGFSLLKLFDIVKKKRKQKFGRGKNFRSIRKFKNKLQLINSKRNCLKIF